MRGPKPIPPEMKVLTGNPGRRPIPKSPKANIGIPEPPDWLLGYAREEWLERAPGLMRMRILGTDDVAAFAAYCQSWAIYRQAAEQLKKVEIDRPGGMLVIQHPQTGHVRRNPFLSAMMDAGADMVKYAAEFGLTASARSRVSMTPESESSPIKGLLYKEKGA